MARYWDAGEGGQGTWRNTISVVTPVVPFNVQVEDAVDPYDELDDQGNTTQWPRVPGREEPAPFPHELTPQWPPPPGAPEAVEPTWPNEQPPWFMPQPTPAPAVPEPVDPEFEVSPDSGNLWDKLTPGTSTEFEIPPFEAPEFGFGDVAKTVFPFAGAAVEATKEVAPGILGAGGIGSILVMMMLFKD